MTKNGRLHYFLHLRLWPILEHIMSDFHLAKLHLQALLLHLPELQDLLRHMHMRYRSQLPELLRPFQLPNQPKLLENLLPILHKWHWHPLHQLGRLYFRSLPEHEQILRHQKHQKHVDIKNFEVLLRAVAFLFSDIFCRSSAWHCSHKT